MRANFLSVIAIVGAATLAGVTQAQSVDGPRETPEGVAMPGGRVVGKAKLIHGYSALQPTPASAASESQRTRNRATVKRFLELPNSEERARLYAENGVKQVPGSGMQWVGLEAQLQNNKEGAVQFPGGGWSNTVLWDTQDPTVFWVEADWSNDPAPGKERTFSHHVLQMVVKDGKIAQYRGFDIPLKLAK